MAQLVVLEHGRSTGISALRAPLDARASTIRWTSIMVPSGAPLPRIDDRLAGIVVMGGTMSAVDPTEHGWMLPELDLLRCAVEADVPVFGVCLGAQLLGRTLGGEVVRRPTPEVAYLPLTRTAAGRDDEVMAGWPDGAAALFLHEDEVAVLPPEASPLLSGSDGVAAWRRGSAVAMQFHPEITGQQIRSWIEGGLLDGLVARAGVDGAALVDEAARRERFVTAQGRALLGRFLDGPVARRARERGAGD